MRRNNITMVVMPEHMPENIPVRPKAIFPVEAAILMALLKREGISARAINPNFFPPEQRLEETSHRIAQAEPDILLVVPPLLTFNIQEDHRLVGRIVRAAKARNPALVAAAAGSFATSFPGRALDELGVDVIIEGDFELQSLALVKYLRSDAGADPKRFAVDASLRMPSLDELPFPDYSGMDYREYFNHPEWGNLRYPEKSRRFTAYQASRGCPCDCSFCNVRFLRGKRGTRVRSPAGVLRHLYRLRDELGIEEVHFLDENITVMRKWALELFAGMKDVGLPWLPGGGINVYTLDEAMLEALRESGCYRLTVALESGSQTILDRAIRKPVVLARDVPRVERAKKMGFEIVAYFIIGFPDETSEERQATLDLAANPAFDYVTLSIASPLPGTRLAEESRARETLLADYPEFRHRANIGLDAAERKKLEALRVEVWDRVNFSDPERRLRLQRMFGVTAEEQERMRRRTRDAFERRWANT